VPSIKNQSYDSIQNTFLANNILNTSAKYVCSMDIFNGVVPNMFALGANRTADTTVKAALLREGTSTWLL